ncbi:hypothetical protein PALU110988_26490 [Paenibacillus lupini]
MIASFFLNAFLKKLQIVQNNAVDHLKHEGGDNMAKQQGHARKNTTSKTSDKKGNSSGNNH